METAEAPRRVRNIAELARIAGVSAGTVSRALSGAGLISTTTRERIKTLAREHGFTPNELARNLRTQRTGAIGVVIPLGHETSQHISDPFFMTILGALGDALTERGYDLLLSRVIPSGDDWLARFVDTGRVDGIVVIGQSDQRDALERVAERFRPLVVWGSYKPGQRHCCVGSDNRLGGRLATAHLIERGCRRIAFFGDPRGEEIAERLEGCRSAMAEAGLSDRLEVVPAPLVAEAAHADIARFLESSSRKPQGVVAASDIIAMSAMRALAEHGLSIPDGVRVVGYDDLPIARQTFPPLTSVRQDFAGGAAALADNLFRRIAGEDTPSIVMAPELMVRQSC